MTQILCKALSIIKKRRKSININIELLLKIIIDCKNAQDFIEGKIYFKFFKFVGNLISPNNINKNSYEIIKKELLNQIRLLTDNKKSIIPYLLSLLPFELIQNDKSFQNKIFDLMIFKSNSFLMSFFQ